jgi:hypothetical protein
MKPLWIAALCALALAPAAVTLAQDAGTAPATTPGTLNAQPSAAPQACPRTLLTDYDPNKGEFFGHDTPIWSLSAGSGSDGLSSSSSAVMFQSGMTIDADGAPNAYNPDNTGLDDIVNAGSPGHWDGIVVDRDGSPLIQAASDPFPGFYVSCTALVDWNKARTDPTRYVDASKIPYIVLPGDLSRQIGARLGDFALVMNIRRRTAAYAIFADIGTLGEGSVALADQLGIWSNAREGGTRGGILYVVYPGSGNRQPRTMDEINAEGDKLFEAFGGAERINSCATFQPRLAGPVPPAGQAPPAGPDQPAAKNFH